MAHGTRGRWIRIAATGLGVMLCTGLVGCWNADKPKDGKIGKQPGPGLPGMPLLPEKGTNTTIGKNGQPGNQFGNGGLTTGGMNNPLRPGIQPINYNPPQPNNFGGIGTPTPSGVVPQVTPSGYPVGAHTGSPSSPNYGSSGGNPNYVSGDSSRRADPLPVDLRDVPLSPPLPPSSDPVGDLKPAPLSPVGSPPSSIK